MISLTTRDGGLVELVMEGWVVAKIYFGVKDPSWRAFLERDQSQVDYLVVEKGLIQAHKYSKEFTNPREFQTDFH